MPCQMLNTLVRWHHYVQQEHHTCHIAMDRARRLLVAPGCCWSRQQGRNWLHQHRLMDLLELIQTPGCQVDSRRVLIASTFVSQFKTMWKTIKQF